MPASLSAKACVFSGMKPDTEEHIIPDWLQRRFKLRRATYQLPSASGLDYRHAKVPAKKEFNEFFGKIEMRISQNKFVWEEIYLWLLKIHVGLMCRDTSLKTDPKDDRSAVILRDNVIAPQLNIFRRMVVSYMNEGILGTSISPPGSVFILKSLSGKYFDFQHSFTTGCIGVNIGDFYLAGSLWDFQCAKDFGYFDWVWNKRNYYEPPSGWTAEEIASWYHHVQAVWLCSLGYWSFRWNINMYRITNDFSPVEPDFIGLPHQRAENSRELALICQTFGLELKKFRPDGKSIFGAMPGRAGGSKRHPSRV